MTTIRTAARISATEACDSVRICKLGDVRNESGNSVFSSLGLDGRSPILAPKMKSDLREYGAFSLKGNVINTDQNIAHIYETEMLVLVKIMHVE
ncbi:unnamed protein product [Haemonchus placei]|uniref:Protein kinase domain-containing protein n=1 Tax=Haemonchus placei TaxID=6290 RepID=A0A0N4VSJ3_HAEPC|nr:unnamed protein product [Haemonchus placei]